MQVNIHAFRSFLVMNIATEAIHTIFSIDKDLY